MADRQAADHKREQKLAEAAKELEAYGIVVLELAFAGKSVRLYSKGYAQIYFMRRSKAEIERIRRVSAQTTGMSAVLTITTDSDTHVLRTSGKRQEDVDKVLKWESTAQAILNDLATTKVTTQPPQSRQTQPPRDGGSTLADQLQKLAELHKSGALTDEEFGAAKARLLG